VPADASQDDLLEVVEQFNADRHVHAYIIQHPVPPQMDFNQAMLAMAPDKDADGLHPVNLGRLTLGVEAPLPCTPRGIVELLRRNGIPLAGAEVCVIGRGTTVGRPLGLLLTRKSENSTVTLCHTGTVDLARHTREADILVAATGLPSIITPDMVKPGAVVVSGGISWEGRKLLPDVDESCGDVAGWITPRLGGVGPTTVAMLLRNTVEAAERTLAAS
jgi:methylenetetrahydrofolate dehydrogenase (NADP+)/methenyltetrahydrofolate cyclohydrolase